MRYILMLFVLFSILSCEKESGFIPDPHLNDPYYSALEPQLQWRADMPMYVSRGNYRIIDDLIIIYGSRQNNSSDETISAYHSGNGDLLWTLNISDLLLRNLSGPILHFHLIKEGQILYFIDLTRGRTFLINVENGNLIEMRSLNGIKTFGGFTGLMQDQSFFHLDHKGDGQNTLFKYDIFEQEVEKLIDLNDYKISNGLSQAVYHESENILYLRLYLDYTKNVLLALDLNTKKIHELWSKSDSVNLVIFPSEPLLLIDDKLIFDSGYGEIIAINRISGAVEWVSKKDRRARIDNIFTHMGNVYILIDGKPYAIDHQTGTIKWKNNITNIYKYVSLHPDEDLLIARNHHMASIYDLTNGQKLVEWNAAVNAEGENPPVVFTTYHEKTKSIYVGTTNELMKYNWPLP